VKHVFLSLLLVALCFVGFSAPAIMPIAQGVDYTCENEFYYIVPDDWNMLCYMWEPDIETGPSHNGNCYVYTYQDCYIKFNMGIDKMSQCQTCTISVYMARVGLDWLNTLFPDVELDSVCSTTWNTATYDVWSIYKSGYCPDFGGDDDQQDWIWGLICNHCNP